MYYPYLPVWSGWHIYIQYTYIYIWTSWTQNTCMQLLFHTYIGTYVCSTVARHWLVAFLKGCKHKRAPWCEWPMVKKTHMRVKLDVFVLNSSCFTQTRALECGKAITGQIGLDWSTGHSSAGQVYAAHGVTSTICTSTICHYVYGLTLSYSEQCCLYSKYRCTVICIWLSSTHSSWNHKCFNEADK